MQAEETSTGPMSVIVAINQQESIRRGVPAPNSSARIQLDLAALTQEERAFVASSFTDGRITGVWATAPTAAGLVEGIRKEMVKYAEQESRDKDTRARVLTATLAAHAARKTTDGRSVEFQPAFTWSRVFASLPSQSDSSALESPDAKAWFAEIAAENVRRKAVALSEATAKEAAKARAVRLAAQREAKVASVGGVLAAKWAAKRATIAEVDALIRADECKARGVSWTGSEKSWNRDDSDMLADDFPLTDDQWNAMAAWQTMLPKEAKLTLYDIYDKTTNEYGDEDGGTHRRLLIAEASWRVGEVGVRADREIGTLKDTASK